MSSTIHLSPHSEALLKEQLARGHYRSPEEVVEHALEVLAHNGPASSLTPSKTPAEAIAEILEIQKRNRLDGLKIKELIQEGHKH